MRPGPLVVVASGSITNPVDGTVMCTTVALQGGAWMFAVAGSCDVAVRYQVKTVTGLLVLADRRPAAGDIDWLQPSEVQIVQGEIVQVVIVGSPAATVALTLYGTLVR